MSESRRTFLKCAADLAACATGLRAQNASPVTIPNVPFGKHQISRLVVGSNQFNGFSHFNPLLDNLMREWNTPERVADMLRSCERNGINTLQYSHHDHAQAGLELFRAGGGKMRLVAVAGPKDSVEDMIGQVKPEAVYYHGEATDALFKKGNLDAAREFTKKIRQTGVLVGVGTHQPEVVERIEGEGWDVDFYLLCAYKRTRSAEELRKLMGEVPIPSNEIYLPGDPARAYKVVRQTKKTCFVFKILAAGRLTRTPEMVDDAFRTAYESIKPNDCVIVGMYPRFKDEVKENAQRVSRILHA